MKNNEAVMGRGGGRGLSVGQLVQGRASREREREREREEKEERVGMHTS